MFPISSGNNSKFEIKKSLRFRSGSSLTKILPTSVTTDPVTISFWVKRGELGVDRTLISATSGTAWRSSFLHFTSSDTLRFYTYAGASTSRYGWFTTRVFRDPSAWLHIVLAVDVSIAGQASRRLWINGVEETSFTAEVTGYNAISNAHYIFGNSTNTLASSIDAHITDFHYIQGQALDASYFGKINQESGSWVPKQYFGDYGTYGFHLDFNDGSAVQSDITLNATATAPFGGVAASAQSADTVYFTSNTSTGGAFDAVVYDFGEPVDFSYVYLGGCRFTGGASTCSIQVSDNGTDWTTLHAQAITSTGTNYTINYSGRYRYIKARMTAFGTNGQFVVDHFGVFVHPLGKDVSESGNNWLVNSISLTTGITYDWMDDTPTNNFPVWNNLETSIAAISNGNLTMQTAASTQQNAYATFHATGAYYAEFNSNNMPSNNSNGIGAQYYISSNGTTTGRFYTADGTFWNGASQVAYGASYSSSNTIGVAIDNINGTLEFFKDGISQGLLTSQPTDEFAFRVYGFISGGQTSIHANFGQRPFAHTPPTGFKKLCTKNLTSPDVKNSSKYFDATLYTGDDTNNRLILNSSGMNPDFVWMKSRSAAYGNVIYDVDRGDSYLATASTGAESASSTLGWSDVGPSSGGFLVDRGTNASINELSTSYVGWQWKKGINSGFDIVTWTGDGTGTIAIPHNLGRVPKLAITKSRSASGDWIVNTTVIDGSHDYLYLHTTAAKGDAGPAAPSSTHFNTSLNTLGVTYVAYLWADIEGFSKVGKYTGNGSAAGPFIWCGFRPGWIMIKEASGASAASAPWIIYDTARDTYNTVTQKLAANSSQVENNASSGGTSAQNLIDILSNGFKLRTANTATNESAGVYLYIAFAECPFKYANAR